jgi:membrane glycosyltransferase
LDRALLVNGLLVSNRSYEKTRIGEGIMAIVCERLGCFEEARRGLVNGLKSSTPGRDRKWCERAVQGKEFVAAIGLHSLRLRGLEYK